MGSVHLNLARRGDHRRIQIIADREGPGSILMVLAPLVSTVVGAGVSALLGLRGPEIFLGMAVSLGGGILAMRGIWGRTTRSWNTKLQRLLGRTTDVLETTGGSGVPGVTETSPAEKH
ncbi:MAG: hypothetical protein ACREMA_04835 [Longimicrobiales bacterium]